MHDTEITGCIQPFLSQRSYSYYMYFTEDKNRKNNGGDLEPWIQLVTAYLKWSSRLKSVCGSFWFLVILTYTHRYWFTKRCSNIIENLSCAVSVSILNVRRKMSSLLDKFCCCPSFRKMSPNIIYSNGIESS